MPHPVEVKDMIKNLDDHNIMNVNYKKFLELMTDKIQNKSSDNDLKKAFSIFDRDGSGSIDSAEFRFVLKNIAADFSESEIDEMIK